MIARLPLAPPAPPGTVASAEGHAHHRISSAVACADEGRRQRCNLAFLVTPDALRLRP